MATGSMVPYSNPAGNNQTTPKSTAATSSPVAMPVASAVQPTAAAQQNPLIPSVVPTSVAAPAPVWDGSQATNIAPIVPGGVASNNLQTQAVDIYGQGVGASLFNLINNSSGVDSTVLQEYEQSLVPQEAKAQANLNTSLGAAGVNGNSSVAGLADANLQAEEFAQVSSEAANLTMNNQTLDANLLQGMEGSAIKEVSSSPLTVLGSVLGDVGSAVSDVMGLGDITGMFGGGGSAGGAGAVPQAPQSNEDDLLMSLNTLTGAQAG